MITIEQFNQQFTAFTGPLKSYLLRITASVPDTEDIVHDTYLKASGKLDTFRGDASLKTWVFTIASNLAKDNLRAQKRWAENVTDICRREALDNAAFFHEAMRLHTASPQGAFEIREHIAFCFTCISRSLPLEQQLCIFLKEVYEFKVAEMATILDLSEAMVKYYLHAGRSKMISIFDGRCALISKEGVCHQCSELNGIFNPKQNFAEEAVRIDMVRESDSDDRGHLFSLRMKILQELDPFESAGAALQQHHLEHNRIVMEKYVG